MLYRMARKSARFIPGVFGRPRMLCNPRGSKLNEEITAFDMHAKLNIYLQSIAFVPVNN